MVRMNYIFHCVASGLLVPFVYASNPPALNLTLTPKIPKNNGSPSLKGELVFESPALSNGSEFVFLPLVIVGILGQAYDNSNLTATDASGPLALTFVDGVNDGSQQLRTWSVARATHGDVTLSFTALPRNVTLTTRVGPLFDMRAQTNGIMAAGLTFVPAPVDLTKDYTVTLDWDLSCAQKGSRAVWSYGDGPGPITKVGSADVLLYTFYAAGRLKSLSQSGDFEYEFVWFDEPPFNTTEVSDFVASSLASQREFWKDNETSYRVFVRRNFNFDPNSPGGGTALYRSFMFGWHNGSTADKELDYLLAHELTHNWPTLDGPAANATTYNEGLAEYYSLRLLWRSGKIGIDDFAAAMNDRISQYYANSVNNLTDAQVQSNAWNTSTLQTQKIPYGRGLIYFTNVDAAMRSKYNESFGLDVLPLTLLGQQRESGRAPLLEDYFMLLRQFLGQDAVAYYQQVASGSPLIVPSEGSLGPCFDVVKIMEFPPTYQWVKNNREPDSNCLV